MNATTLVPLVQPGAGVIVGVDLAKNVFQLCVADATWRPKESLRLTRTQFERWFAHRAGLCPLDHSLPPRRSRNPP